MKQLSFAEVEFSKKPKQTRRERFLLEMEAVVPWARLEAVIKPHYPKTGNGRSPYKLSVMLRIHCMQQWFGYGDAAMEEALHEVPLLRRFAGLDIGSDTIPDESTILGLRHLLERHGLSGLLFAEVNALLMEKGLLLRGCHADCRTVLDQEPGRQTRPRDDTDPEGQSMVFWHEGSHWRGRSERIGAHVHRYHCQDLRHVAIHRTAAW